jgi:hypothetical protein
LVHLCVLELTRTDGPKMLRTGRRFALWALLGLGVLFCSALVWSRKHRMVAVPAAPLAAVPKPGHADPPLVHPAVPNAAASDSDQAEEATEPASETSEPEPTAEDCAHCLRTVCASEVAAGASVEAAQCLIACEYWMPKEMCMSGKGPPLFYRAPPRPLCAGHPRTPATLALVECGKACPCPVMRWNEPGEHEARARAGASGEPEASPGIEPRTK